MGPLRSTPSLPLTICNWRLGLPTFSKMAAAGRETGEEAMRLKEGAKNQGTGGDRAGVLPCWGVSRKYRGSVMRVLMGSSSPTRFS